MELHECDGLRLAVESGGEASVSLQRRVQVLREAVLRVEGGCPAGRGGRGFGELLIRRVGGERPEAVDEGHGGEGVGRGQLWARRVRGFRVRGARLVGVELVSRARSLDLLESAAH